MQNERFHFILIEDSKLDTFVGETIIRGLGAVCLTFRSFLDPEEALRFMEASAMDSVGGGAPDAKTIVLLDIQMPLMTGFDFIEQFEQRIPPEQRANYIINMLSSSINEKDMIRAHSYQSVNLFLNKPLKKEMIMDVIRGLRR